MTRILVSLFFFISTFSFADVDSLENVLNKTINPRDKVIIYNLLANEYWHSNTTRAMLCSDSAYSLALKHDIKGQDLLDAIVNKGITAYTLGQYFEASNFYNQAIKLAIDSDLRPYTYVELQFNLLRKQGAYKQIIQKVDSILKFDQNVADFKDKFLNIKVVAHIDLGQAIEAGELIRSLEKQDSLNIAQSSFNLTKASYYNIVGNYDQAISILDSTLIIYQNQGDSLEMAKVFKQMALTYLLQGQYDKVLTFSNNALEIYTKANYPYGIAQAYYVLGSLYAEMGKNELAVEYYYKALPIYESQTNKKELALTYNDLAYLYARQDKSKAFEYLNKSINISRKIGDLNTEGTSFNFMGIFFDQLKKYDSAIWAYNKSISLRQSINYERGVAAVEFNKGSIYEKLGDYDKAIALYLRSYEVDTRIGNVIGMAISEYYLGGLMTKMKKFAEAKIYFDKALKKLRDRKANVYLIECLQKVATYYEAINDAPQALKYYKEYIALKETVFNLETEIRLAELEERAELDKKNKEIEILNLANKNRQQDILIQEKTIANQRFLIGFISFGIVSVSLLLLITFRLLKIRSKTNKQLEKLNREITEQAEEITAQAEELKEANEEISLLNEGLEATVSRRTNELKLAKKELDTFFYHASHDFRRPLTTFLGLAEIAQSILDDPKALELFDKVRETAGSLDRMVSKLKAISIIGFEKNKFSDIDMLALINAILAKQKTLINQSKIEVRLNIQATHYYSSYDLVEIILENLIENAVLYSDLHKQSWISIANSQYANKLLITVSDNGQGIDDSLTPRIFDMYYRANEASQGNGLGLYIAKMATEKLKGEITFETKLGEGTIFTIKLPNTEK